MILDTENISPLEEFWEQYKSQPSDDGHGQSEQPISPFTAAQRRNRALSSLTLAHADQTLPPYHPAHSILEYLDTFGPLVFPLHRAALLRKRILLINPPPVKLTCEYGTLYAIALLIPKTTKLTEYAAQSMTSRYCPPSHTLSHHIYRLLRPPSPDFSHSLTSAFTIYLFSLATLHNQPAAMATLHHPQTLQKQ
jgi:hypothetical protein